MTNLLEVHVAQQVDSSAVGLQVTKDIPQDGLVLAIPYDAALSIATMSARFVPLAHYEVASAGLMRDGLAKMTAFLYLLMQC
jgi:hypothetical protein